MNPSEAFDAFWFRWYEGSGKETQDAELEERYEGMDAVLDWLPVHIEGAIEACRESLRQAFRAGWHALAEAEDAAEG